MKSQIIKVKMALFSIVAILLFFACEKSDDLNSNDVTGTYVGTLTANLINRSSANAVTKDATVVVSRIGGQIKAHCFAADFDTTIKLDIYNHNDSVLVCLTEKEFEAMYGHMLGQNHMNGSMHNDGTEWMQHLNNEHQEGDEHFGGFDMQHHSFDYTFRMNYGDFHFKGVKN